MKKQILLMLASLCIITTNVYSNSDESDDEICYTFADENTAAFTDYKNTISIEPHGCKHKLSIPNSANLTEEDVYKLAKQVVNGDLVTLLSQCSSSHPGRSWDQWEIKRDVAIHILSNQIDGKNGYVAKNPNLTEKDRSDIFVGKHDRMMREVGLRSY